MICVLFRVCNTMLRDFVSPFLVIKL